MPTDLRLYRTLATFRTIRRTYVRSRLSLSTLDHNSCRLPNSFRPSRTMIDTRSPASTGSGTYGYCSEHPTRIRASFPLTSTILIPYTPHYYVYILVPSACSLSALLIDELPVYTSLA